MTVNVETKPCQCGKKMIKRARSTMLMSCPPKVQMEWWCGGCGAEEKAEIVSVDQDEPALERWKRAQEPG